MQLKLTSAQHKARAKLLLDRARSAPEADRQQLRDLARKHLVQARFAALREDFPVYTSPTIH
jgi:hypothetical protein